MARKTVLVISMLSFAAMTTGLVMFIHLHNVEHPEHHNHDNCQICQNSLVSSKKAIIEPAAQIKHIALNPYYVQLYFQEITTTTRLHSTCPRAPPVI